MSQSGGKGGEGGREGRRSEAWRHGGREGGGVEGKERGTIHSSSP